MNVLHNLVHLLLGVAGIAAAATASLAAGYLVVGGLAYLGLWVYGLVIDLDSGWNFAALNTADNWLHLVLAVLMVGLAAILLPSSRIGRTRT